MLQSLENYHHTGKTFSEILQTVLHPSHTKQFKHWTKKTVTYHTARNSLMW